MRRILNMAGSIGLVVLLAACGNGKEKDPSDGKDRYFEVERGDFTITIEQEGMLDAIKHHVLRCPARARSGLEIMHVVEDQTRVTNNQVVARFVDEKYVDTRDDLFLEIDEQEKTLLLEQDNFQMNQSKSLSDIKTRVDKLRDERAALRKYVEQDAVMERKDLNRDIELKQEALVTAEDKVATQASLLATARMSEKDKVDTYEKQLVAAENALETAVRDLDKSRYKLRIFKQYDHPRQMRQLEQKKVLADMELQNELIRVKGVTLQGERKISTNQRKLIKQQRDLKQVQEELLKMVIRAPTDGIVTLGDPHRRNRGSEKEIKIGTTMSQNEVIGSIPDLSRFVVKMNLPEIFRSRIALQQPAKMGVKALPDLMISGYVDAIDDMASRLVFWDPGSPKVYITEIATDSHDPRLMPGMSISVEIQVETVRDCLYVPIEALYSREGETFCRVKQLTGYEERKVETGRSSSDFAEVTSGLESGEKVLLHRDGV